MRTLRNLAAVAAAVGVLAATNASAQAMGTPGMGPGMMGGYGQPPAGAGGPGWHGGPGYGGWGMGPGMMGGYGGGYGGYGMGPGMMGGYGGWGMGPGMMGGYGGGYGGMMGPGMMGGYGAWGGMMGPGMMGGYGGYGMGPGMMGGWGGWGPPIEFSDAQRKQIDALQQDLEAKRWALMNQMHTQMLAMRQAYGADGKFDEGAARAAFDAMFATRKQMADLALDAHKRFDAILTDAQREQLRSQRCPGPGGAPGGKQ